jgi:hypothetical protein
MDWVTALLSAPDATGDPIFLSASPLILNLGYPMKYNFIIDDLDVEPEVLSHCASDVF